MPPTARGSSWSASTAEFLARRAAGGDLATGRSCWHCATGRSSPTTRSPPSSPAGAPVSQAHGLTLSLSVPGAHNALNAAGGARGLPRWSAPTSPGRRPRSAPSRGVAPALRAARPRRRPERRLRRLRPPSDRGRGDPGRRAHARRRGAWSSSSSRTSTRAPSSSPASSARRWPRADVIAVLDVYPARERAEDFPGCQRPARRRRRGRRRRRPPGLLAARCGRRRAASSAAASNRRPLPGGRCRRRRPPRPRPGRMSPEPVADFPPARLTTVVG